MALCFSVLTLCFASTSANNGEYKNKSAAYKQSAANQIPQDFHDSQVSRRQDSTIASLGRTVYRLINTAP